MKSFLIAAGAVAVLTGAAQAKQITLTPGSVVANSGGYAGGATVNPGDFSAGHIFDQQSGSVVDGHAYDSPPATYWLNGNDGPANAYITVDLGAAYRLDSFDLFNTHNTQYYDRGTGAFSIRGSNSLDFAGSTLLVDGTLNAAPNIGGNPFAPIAAQSFTSLSDAKFRYIQFLPTSVAVAGRPCCGANVYGLNELRVFGAVPEPATWAMMIGGFGLMGFAMRRRRATVAFA